MSDARTDMPGWIPVWIHPRDAKIMRLSVLTGDLPETVCGRMLAWFRWIDDNLDGPATGLSREAFHRLIDWKPLDARKKKRGLLDYFDAMQDELVQWLDVKPSGVYVPKFERSFGKSARRRLKDRERKRASRAQNGDSTLYDERTECGHAADEVRTDGGRSAPLEKEREKEQQQEKELAAAPPEEEEGIEAEAARAQPLSLHDAGIRGSTNDELSRQPYMTPQVVGIIQARARADGAETAKNPRAILVQRLRSVEPAQVFDELERRAIELASQRLAEMAVSADTFLAEHGKEVRAWEKSDDALIGISRGLETVGLRVPPWKLSLRERPLDPALRVLCFLEAHPSLVETGAAS